jgi:hypothetical protein
MVEIFEAAVRANPKMETGSAEAAALVAFIGAYPCT